MLCPQQMQQVEVAGVIASCCAAAAAAVDAAAASCACWATARCHPLQHEWLLQQLL
jgi:hypothetical protein